MKILSDIFIPPIVSNRTSSVRLRFDFDDESNKLSIDEFEFENETTDEPG